MRSRGPFDLGQRSRRPLARKRCRPLAVRWGGPPLHGADVTEFIGPAATTRIAGYTSGQVAGGFTLAVTPTSVYGEVGRVFSIGGDARVKSSVQGSVVLQIRWQAAARHLKHARNSPTAAALIP